MSAAQIEYEQLAKSAIERLRKLKESRDIEAAHSEADEVLCELLTSLGFKDVVDAWNAIDRWYA